MRSELYWGGFVSENTDEILLFMDYSFSVMKNKEIKRREKVLDTFSIRKELRLNYDLKDTTEIANHFIKWIVALGNGAVKLAIDYERQERAKYTPQEFENSNLKESEKDNESPITLENANENIEQGNHNEIDEILKKPLSEISMEEKRALFKKMQQGDEESEQEVLQDTQS